MEKSAVVSHRSLIAPIIIAAVVAIIDQLTKWLATSNLIEGETVPVLGTFFQLKLVYNYGGALGTNLGSSSFYLGTSILIFLIILYFIYTNRHVKLIAWPMAACAGGAIGNIIDRIFTGKVVDFLDFDFFDVNLFGQQVTRWWTFNIADVGISVGVVLMILVILFSPRKPQKSTIESEMPANQSQTD